MTPHTEAEQVLAAQLSEALRSLKDANGKLETLRSVRTDLCKALGLGLDATWGDVERRCVAVRERVAELEADNKAAHEDARWWQKTYANDCQTLQEIAEKKERKLEGELRIVGESAALYCKERDAAIAERDYLKEQVATLERNLNNESEEHDSMTDALKAENDKLRAELSQRITELAQAHRERVGLQTEVKHLTSCQDDLSGTIDELTADLDAVFEALGLARQNYDDGRILPASEAVEAVDKLRAEVERLTTLAITLPTDTTTPLDLAQRAVALMGGRVVFLPLDRAAWLRLDGYGRLQIRFPADDHLAPDSTWSDLDDAADSWWGRVMSDQVVTLAPEPEPARRKLSFGEAVELACSVGKDEGRRGPVATWNGYKIVCDPRGLAEIINSGGVRVLLSPALLAAEWEACE